MSCASRHLRKLNLSSCCQILAMRGFSSEIPKESIPSTTSAGTQASIDFSKIVDSIVRDSSQGKSFARMLRESKFMQLGDISNRVVVGRIVNRVQDDLYIDVGLKFNAVCKAPALNGDSYRVGSQVIVRLHDVELSERFLGSKKDLTLLEADATLIRLVGHGPKKTHSSLAQESSSSEVGTSSV